MCGINRSVTPETFQIVHKHSHLFFYSSHIQSLLNLIISLLFLGRRRRERFVRRFLLLYTSCHLLASHTHTHTTHANACCKTEGVRCVVDVRRGAFAAAHFAWPHTVFYKFPVRFFWRVMSGRMLNVLGRASALPARAEQKNHFKLSLMLINSIEVSQVFKYVLPVRCKVSMVFDTGACPSSSSERLRYVLSSIE